MKIDHIQFKHSYHFSDLKIHFQTTAHPITVILGEQASGKTAIIKNIYQAMTWFSSRLKDLRSAGVVMLDQDIMYQRSRSKIDIGIEIPSEIGTLPERSDHHNQDLSLCHWQLYKTLNSSGTGISRVDTTQLEECIALYTQAIKQDPLIGLPMIAYYPSERFTNEVNLLSKNNPAIFHSHAAYEFAAIPFTTFARFFEWYREISDIENAQTAQLFLQLISTEALANEPDLLSQARAQHYSPSLNALKHCLSIVMPDLSDIYLEYQPKLQLMVTYDQQTCIYQQLSSSIKNWIALVGDVVRRLCLLNPMSLFPCEEGEGILLIDQIDLGLDQEWSATILDRLHQAFPLLQIIVTGQQHELLDNSPEYQYLKLEHKQLTELHCKNQWQQYEQLYQQMQQLQQTETQFDGTDTTVLLEQSKAQALFEQIQQLSDVEQSELSRLMQADDDTSQPIPSSSC